MTSVSADAMPHVTSPAVVLTIGYFAIGLPQAAMFGAVTLETSLTKYHRIRWSHPNEPEAWRELDYIDIEAF